MSKLCTLLGGTAATSTWDINRSGVRTGTQPTASSQQVSCFQRIFILAFCHIQSKPKLSADSCSTLIHLISLSGTAVLRRGRSAQELSQEWQLPSRLHQSNFTGKLSQVLSSQWTNKSNKLHHYSTWNSQLKWNINYTTQITQDMFPLILQLPEPIRAIISVEHRSFTCEEVREIMRNLYNFDVQISTKRCGSQTMDPTNGPTMRCFMFWLHGTFLQASFRSCIAFMWPISLSTTSG